MSVPATVAILGDSRVFDTYYTNDLYRQRYGYNKTFPFLLSKATRARNFTCDVVHIPDHFRAGTVENNIIRLALNDPDIVILCDGIWETLVRRQLFDRWLEKQPADTDRTYSTRRLTDLFVANELTVSPKAYAEKQKTIISYFHRRRRRCMWLSLPMPPREHLDRMHFAGNYQCIPEWDECLKAVNEAMGPIVSSYGADWLDLHELVQSNGGFAQCLIDQWHFSESFHAVLASEIERRVIPWLADCRDHAHASRRFMLARPLADEPVIVVGKQELISQWRDRNTSANVDLSVVSEAGTSPTVLASRCMKSSAACVLFVDPALEHFAFEAAFLSALSPEKIVLTVKDIGAIENPADSDRRQHAILHQQ